MTKSLKIIQVIFKIVKILAMIAFICCIVGAAFSLTGLLVISFIPADLALSNGKTFNEMLMESAGITKAGVIATLIVATVACGASIVLTYKEKKYCENELKAGTPFTFDGSKELFRLAIWTIAIGVGTAFVSGIVTGIVEALESDFTYFDFDFSINIGSGIFYLFLSLIFKHGAEVAEQLIEKNNGVSFVEEKTEVAETETNNDNQMS